METPMERSSDEIAEELIQRIGDLLKDREDEASIHADFTRLVLALQQASLEEGVILASPETSAELWEAALQEHLDLEGVSLVERYRAFIAALEQALEGRPIPACVDGALNALLTDVARQGVRPLLIAQVLAEGVEETEE